MAEIYFGLVCQWIGCEKHGKSVDELNRLEARSIGSLEKTALRSCQFLSTLPGFPKAAIFVVD